MRNIVVAEKFTSGKLAVLRLIIKAADDNDDDDNDDMMIMTMMRMMMMMCMKISGGSDNQSSPILVGYEGKHDHCLLLDLQYQTITIP